LLGLLCGSITDLEADGLELARELLDVVLAEIVLDDECLELDGLNVTPLLTLLDERAGLLTFKQFLKLMLCQAALYVLSSFGGNLLTLRGRSDLKPSHYVTYFLVFPGQQGRSRPLDSSNVLLSLRIPGWRAFGSRTKRVYS
jgi:hypothetical protein